MGEERNVYRVLMGKRPLGRPRRRWEDGIRMDLREIGWGSLGRIQLAQDRDRWRALENTVMNQRVLTPRSELCDVTTVAAVKTLWNIRPCVFCLYVGG
jgi:hypothetical protein